MKNINQIWKLIELDKNALDQAIIENSYSDIDLNNQVSEYIIHAGGKRIRPLVLLLLAKALKYEGDLQYKLAAAIEFIHTATLLHDDVVDESNLRRNRPTANNIFGNSAAVLVGDFLYTRAFQIISIELEAAKVMADATNDLASGEVMQLMNIKNFDISEADYIKTIHLKTAVLFSAACQFSAIIGDSPNLQDSFADYGKYLGYAFQIADDVLDYAGDINNTGKNIGDDLSEQKLTLPLIHCLNSNTKNKKRLLEIIETADLTAINELIDILNNSKSIDYCIEKANHYATLAKNSISTLEESIYKQALLNIADIAVSRNN